MIWRYLWDQLKSSWTIALVIALFLVYVGWAVYTEWSSCKAQGGQLVEGVTSWVCVRQK